MQRLFSYGPRGVVRAFPEPESAGVFYLTQLGGAEGRTQAKVLTWIDDCASAGPLSVSPLIAASDLRSITQSVHGAVLYAMELKESR